MIQRQTTVTKGHRFIIVASFVVLGGFAVWFRIQETQAASELAQSGIPVSAALGTAAILGLIVSVIIFRTPHDGSTEL